MDGQGKVALITGASAGIGRATAIRFLGAGWRVVLAGRRADELDATIAKAGAPAGMALAVPTNVADPASVAALFDRTRAVFGRLDVLFNNAGVNAPGIPLEELTYEQWKNVVDVNLTGAFLCTQHAFRIMKDQTPRGGRIINNGSIAAQVPRPRSAAYTVTKHAVTGLTKQIALDGRGDGIACSQIDIGNAATEMTAGMATGMLQPDGSRKAEARMDASHVADAVVMIARLPLEANVPQMTLLATAMPFGGRG